MKNLTKTLLVALLVIVPFTSISAQHIDKKEISHWSFGLKGGTSWWNFTSPGVYQGDWDFGWHGGFVLEYTINPVFGFGLDAGYYNHDGLDATFDENTLKIPFKNQAIDGLIFGSVNLSNLFSPARQGKFWKATNIYTNFGIGAGAYDYETATGTESDFKVAPLAAAGLNIEFNLGKKWALGVGGDYRWHFRDDLSGAKLGRNTESVNAQLLLRYKFNAGKKKHVRNLTTAEFYPQPAPVVVVDNIPNEEVMNRIKTLENQNNQNKQKIQELEQKSARINQEVVRAENKIQNLEHHDPVANLVVENIQFVLNQKDLSTTNRAILDQVAAILLANMNSWKSLEISGYTDATGAESGNIRLSETRAKLVANYLMSKGISSSRITSVKGFGSIKPIADNATAAGRDMNRRVEVNIVK